MAKISTWQLGTGMLKPSTGLMITFQTANETADLGLSGDGR